MKREFSAAISKIEDGDTVYAWCDMGFDDWHYAKIRLKGTAARKLSLPGGKEARDFLIGLLPPRTYPDDGPTCVVYSYKWDKFAPRIDGDILLFNGRLASELMIESGYAAPWDGKGTQPTPEWPLPQRSNEGGSLFLP